MTKSYLTKEEEAEYKKFFQKVCKFTPDLARAKDYEKLNLWCMCKWRQMKRNKND